MRLRYFHIRHYPPLQDVEIVFSAQSPLNTANAIHFVVGVNGSGKTHLLQALVETFLCLERKQPPQFPVTLVYELGTEKQHTFVFDHADEATAWWQFDKPDDGKAPFERDNDKADFQTTLQALRQHKTIGWKNLIVEGGWPGSDVGLPHSVIAYTTGLPDGWHELFKPRLSAASLDLDMEQEERPVGWSSAQEQHHNPNFMPVDEDSRSSDDSPHICQFINPLTLKLAVLAVTLNLALDELKQHRTDAERTAFVEAIKTKTPSTGLRELLTQVGWVWPVSLVFECEPTREWVEELKALKGDKTPSSSAAKFLHQYQHAATTILAEPEPSKKQRVCFDLENPSKSKREAFAELLNLSKSPFSIFQQLLNMHYDGVLDAVTIALRKADTDDILLFDELSDGEQMYLGRMALFHLLEAQDDALLLLDEPETHFNDYWKREMVAIIDNVMREKANHVLISTHSSITLTDVFDDEIIRFKKKQGESQVIPLASTTFGADPSEIIMSVFEAEDSIGERSLAWLNAQVEKEWLPEQREELERIIKQIGPGLHRSELRTIWRKLNAPQD